MSDCYNFQPICIAIKHGKEGALARSLLHPIGLNAIVKPELDSDTLGTFSSEYEREETMCKICIQACQVPRLI